MGLPLKPLRDKLEECVSMAERRRLVSLTEQSLIREAIEVQNACNMSGIVLSFRNAVVELNTIAHENHLGTDWINKHRVCRLFADKIKSLTGDIHDGDFNL